MSLSFSSLRKEKNQEHFYVFPDHFEQLQNRGFAIGLVSKNPKQPPPKKPEQTKKPQSKWNIRKQEQGFPLM